jgi:TonB family protein
LNVATTRLPMNELWTQWEGHVINGIFPLRRCLGSSDHSGVFLPEYATQHLPNAALKLVPVIPTLAESQLSQWRAAAALSHPRLLPVFDTGRCQLGDLHFLYAVMEYADQNLAQLLRHRVLSDTEARDMLPPVLDALVFLHARGLVQGQLKPSNILVVGDQLKLASDALRPAGEATASIAMLSAYDPPEGRDGSFSTAGDIWALGVTLVEALTQSSPAKPGERGDAALLPPDFPPSFSDVVKWCLRRDPADRPTVADLQAWLKPESREAPVSASRSAASTTPGADARKDPKRDKPEPTRPHVPRAAAPAVNDTPQRLVIRAQLRREPVAEEPARERRSFLPWVLGIVAVVAIGWAAVHLLSKQANSRPPAANTSAPALQPNESARKPPQTPRVAAQSPAASASSSPASHTKRADASADQRETASPHVLHAEIPAVPRSALETIHGHVRVTVRVTVDSSGNVVGDTLENPGPSRYFARLASQASRKWKFAPAAGHSSRYGLLRFEFSRSGTTASAVPPRS